MGKDQEYDRAHDQNFKSKSLTKGKQRKFKWMNESELYMNRGIESGVNWRCLSTEVTSYIS